MTAGGALGRWEGYAITSRADGFYELGQDQHSLEGDPLFVDVTGKDFHLQSNSPAVDRGDPASAWRLEPANSGGRANLGASGNTVESQQSPSHVIDVLSPDHLEKFELGQEVLIQWHRHHPSQPDLYPSTALEDEPLAYYRLGEAVGTTAGDLLGDGRTGGNNHGDCRRSVTGLEFSTAAFQPIVKPCVEKGLVRKRCRVAAYSVP